MAGRQELENLLALTLVKGGVELRISPDNKPLCKHPDGSQEDLSDTVYSSQQIMELLQSFLGEEGFGKLTDSGSLAFNGKVEDHRFKIRVVAKGGLFGLVAKPEAIAVKHMTIDTGPPSRVDADGQIKLGALKRNLIKASGGLAQLLETMGEYNASDLHLRAGSPACFRVSGQVCPLDTDAFSSDQIREMLYGLIDDAQRATFEQTLDLDVAHQGSDGTRYRINAFHERGAVGLVARRVLARVPTFDELNLPPLLQRIPQIQSGLVLVCGVTGSGKSTTLAATIEAINQTRACNVMTLEDPIEYAYVSKKALIAQREVGIDVRTFGQGLRQVLRQDPDVILIGELRDAETFTTALQAAETGHLVFGTLHSGTVGTTIGRILEMFPESEHTSLRRGLAANLRAIVCQKILPRRGGGGVVPAVEVLFCNPSAQKMIIEGRDAVLADIVAGDDEMQDFNKSLHGLTMGGLIGLSTAMDASPKPERLRMMLTGIQLNEDRKILG